MIVKDLMTRDVAAVGPEADLAVIARALVAHGVSAVPVIDRDGRPLGVVSEGDLIGTGSRQLDERRQWWLAQLAEGHALDAGFLASTGNAGRTARELMSAPAICIDDTADVTEAARRMEQARVKRLPVVRDGRMVGIIARADIVRGLAQEAGSTVNGSQPAPNGGSWPLRHVPAPARRIELPPVPASTGNGHAPAITDVSAAGFRALVEAHQAGIARRREAERQRVDELRRQQMQELRGKRLADTDWHDLLDQARSAATSGAREFLLIRFPAALCSDGGRAINAPDPHWPDTLVGEPADIYRRWQSELKGRGFHLAAQIVDFPDGLPGDAALFLVWRG